MSRKKQTKLSAESFANLQAELRDLEDKQLPAVVERIAKAREQGDLSENSEYKDAKDQQELLEVRIGEIKAILDSAEVVEGGESGDAGARIGSKVTICGEGGSEACYQVVAEYDKTAGGVDTLSAVSPIGRAVLGHQVGDELTVEVPSGVKKFKIIKIE